MTQYYDVWQQQPQGSDIIVPVEVDVKAGSPEQVVEIIAQERGIPAGELQAYEASNPGYREV